MIVCLPPRVLVDGIFDYVQMLLTRFLVLCSKIVHQVVKRIPGQYPQNLWVHELPMKENEKEKTDPLIKKNIPYSHIKLIIHLILCIIFYGGAHKIELIEWNGKAKASLAVFFKRMKKKRFLSRNNFYYFLEEWFG